jgi:heme A synthase
MTATHGERDVITDLHREPSRLRTPVALHVFAMLLAGSTLTLIFVGGLVTSTGSGLAVPDWPLSFGQFFPRMVGGVFYEHGHRMVAATVGALTVWTKKAVLPTTLHVAVGAAILGTMVLLTLRALRAPCAVTAPGSLLATTERVPA